MKKLAFLALALSTTLTAAPSLPALAPAVVSSKECIERSKRGQAERKALEATQKQMTQMLEGKEKELRELALKLQDADYRDGLSDQMLEELGRKYQGLMQEYQQAQQQCMQMFSQKNDDMLHALADNIQEASKTIALKDGFNLIVEKDACFFNAAEFEITESVIAEMDRQFDGAK